jgi:serine-type D-Ala-D-Ala carboxypeptidase/endopeptidase (penicillin-binding protein 4)
VTRELGRSLDSILDDPDFGNAFWGAIVVNARTGEVLFERHAEKNFVPASNTKLFLAAAALEVLGPEFTYLTTLHGNGAISRGILEGDLVIRGSGDPTFGSRWHDGGGLAVYRAWADSLRAAGISRISGDIVGDGRIFDDLPLGRGWNWDDEPNAYAAQIAGLSFNDNTVDFSLTARSPGNPASVSWAHSSTGYVRVNNRTASISRDSSSVVRHRRSRTGNEFLFETRIPAGQQLTPTLSIDDPAAYAAFILKEELVRQGIQVDGTARSIDRRTPYAVISDTRLASRVSPPLSEIVHTINKRSNNHYAEQVLKTIGAVAPVRHVRTERGSSAMGLGRARFVWGTAGVDTTGLRLVDGSGLSRHNIVSPRSTADLLLYIFNEAPAELRNPFYASLPIGGVDGTLQGRFRHGSAHRNVRAKTGTLSGASALSGYVRSRRGDDLVFALMTNNYTAGAADARRVQDAFVERLASW